MHQTTLKRTAKAVCNAMSDRSIFQPPKLGFWTILDQDLGTGKYPGNRSFALQESWVVAVM